MKNIVGAALLLSASSLASAQCVAFLVPPDVPLYADETKTNPYPVVRKDYKLAFPSMKISFENGVMVKIEEGIQTPKTSVPCSPADFKRSKDRSRVRILTRGEHKEGALWQPELAELWMPEKEGIQVIYDAPGAFPQQSAAANTRAIQHAADLKLDEIRNADFKAPEIKNQEIFTADFDKTWSALVETLSDQKWQIESIDKSSGLITTKPAVDKGGNTMACATQFDRGNTTWLNVFAKKTDGGTRIKVNATFHAMREGKAITCSSNGAIEQEIFKGIQENLGPAQPAQTPGKSSP